MWIKEFAWRVQKTAEMFWVPRLLRTNEMLKKAGSALLPKGTAAVPRATERAPGTKTFADLGPVRHAGAVERRADTLPQVHRME